MSRRGVYAVLLATVVAAGVAWLVPGTANASQSSCHNTTSTVTLSTTNPTTYQVRGTLCSPSPIGTRTVQFLVHGASYDRHYWDGFGYQANSYVAAALRAGTATFAIDQIGAGVSDKPDPSLVTFASTAYVLHQLVGDLRNGTLGRYRTVVGVGHSMGAGEWMIEAGTWRDVDGVVLSDFLHTTNPVGVAAVQAAYRPAPGLPDGYVTVPDRTVFYNMQFVKSWIVQADKPSSFSVYQAKTLGVARDPSFSLAIRVSVLVVVGQDDTLGCSSTLPCNTDLQVQQREQSDFRVPVRAVVLPKSGHDTALHPDAPVFFAAADRFALSVR